MALEGYEKVAAALIAAGGLVLAVGWSLLNIPWAALVGGALVGVAAAVYSIGSATRYRARR